HRKVHNSPVARPVASPRRGSEARTGAGWYPPGARRVQGCATLRRDSACRRLSVPTVGNRKAHERWPPGTQWPGRTRRRADGDYHLRIADGLDAAICAEGVPPAASAPFVATLVDVTGLVIYVSVAYAVLRGTLLCGESASHVECAAERR